MKKLTAIILCIILIFSLSACGGGSKEPAADVDVDLTVSGGTVLFAQLTLMTDNTKDYLGKSVRMEGEFSPYPVYSKDGGSQTRCSCIVWDNTKCCTAGLDFVLEGKNYPDGYPEIGKTIIVEGTFEEESLFGVTRGVLKDARLLKVK